MHQKLQQRMPHDAPSASNGVNASLNVVSNSSSGSRASLTAAQASAAKCTVAHFYAALYVQAAIRGFLQRHRIQQRALEDLAAVAAAGEGAGVVEEADGVPQQQHVQFSQEKAGEQLG